MIFGTKAVLDFQKKAERVQFIQFQSKLTNDIKQIFSNYGSVRKVSYSLPGRYGQICFINPDADINSDTYEAHYAELCIKDPFACDVWDDAWEQDLQPEDRGWSSVSETVFLYPYPNDDKIPKIKTYKVTIVDSDEVTPLGYYCPPIINGEFSLILEGKGSHTEISPAADIE